MIKRTIAAISTPPGKGGVAMLRVSGEDAVAICDRVFCPQNTKRLSEQVPRQAIYGSILAPTEAGEWLPIDDGIATVYRAPASFTGEDTVEICCHGGILLTQTVLSALFAAGAHPAEAGEFTRRAFLNGKLGLSAAEALGDILEAQNAGQLALAHNGMRGKIEARAGEIYDALCQVLAGIYVKIDYPDEDLADMSREEMIAALKGVKEQLSSLAATYRTGHAIKEGIPTVICGKPNVGKSSLYNRILGRDAAIVTSIEGTTRDVLSETATLGRVTLRLFDTAGLHLTEDVVEQIGIARAREALGDAELILAVFDGTQAPDAADRALVEELQENGAPVVALLNKSDLGACKEELYRTAFDHVIAFSAQSGEGFATLIDTVEQLFTDGKLDLRKDVILTNARQYGAALAAHSAVQRAVAGLESGLATDLCCTDVEAAMSSLSELDGRAVSEDIVSAIFSHFCVGK